MILGRTNTPSIYKINIIGAVAGSTTKDRNQYGIMNKGKIATAIDQSRSDNKSFTNALDDCVKKGWLRRVEGKQDIKKLFKNPKSSEPKALGKTVYVLTKPGDDFNRACWCLKYPLVLDVLKSMLHTSDEKEMIKKIKEEFAINDDETIPTTPNLFSSLKSLLEDN